MSGNLVNANPERQHWCSRAAEFAAFDSLPAAVRRALDEAPVRFSAAHCRKVFLGYQRWFGFTIAERLTLWRIERRERLIRINPGDYFVAN